MLGLWERKDAEVGIGGLGDPYAAPLLLVAVVIVVLGVLWK